MAFMSPEAAVHGPLASSTQQLSLMPGAQRLVDTYMTSFCCTVNVCEVPPELVCLVDVHGPCLVPLSGGPCLVKSLPGWTACAPAGFERP
jgi:hypothetical protein